MDLRYLCRSVLSKLTTRVTIVKEREIVILSKFSPKGRSNKVLPVGIYFLIPFLDRVVQRHTAEEQLITIKNEQVFSKDRLQVKLETSYTVQIFDALKAAFPIKDCSSETLLILDALKATHNLNDYQSAAIFWFQKKVREEFKKLNYEQFTLMDYALHLNKSISGPLNRELIPWGVVCRRLKTEILWKESGSVWTTEHAENKASITIVSPIATKERRAKEHSRELQKNLSFFSRLMNSTEVYVEFMDEVAGILLRSAAVTLTDNDIKRWEFSRLNQLFLYLALSNKKSKYNIPPSRIGFFWDWENLSLKAALDLHAFQNRLRIVFEANEVFKTDGEELPPLMLFSSANRLAHLLPDGFNHIETQQGKDETDYELIKYIILWHYKFSWCEREEHFWQIFKSWALSKDKEKLEDNSSFLVLISEDHKNSKVLKQMAEMGHRIFVICSLKGEQLINESHQHLLWSTMISSKELTRADYIATKNPKYYDAQQVLDSVELPAPSGWTKKFFPKKSGTTPERNLIVFTSPTGEEISTRRDLAEYLKTKGGPNIMEFDWGTKSSASKKEEKKGDEDAAANVVDDKGVKGPEVQNKD